MFGKILKSTGNQYKIELEDTRIVLAKLRGKIRLKDIDSTNPISVGDFVELIKENDEDEFYLISDICKRKNFIVRKSTNLSKQKQILASNVDLAILFFTWKEPKTHILFIDRFLVSLESFRIPTIIIFNKTDLCDDKEICQIEEISKIYKGIGYNCFNYSIYKNENKDELIEIMKNKQVLIAGNSGVGKSSFINSLYPNIKIKMREISSVNKQGKHTTTFAEMYRLESNTYVIDTPGIRAFGLIDISMDLLSHYFPEMRLLLGKCRYHNCLHLNEPNCAVKEALNNGDISSFRYQNYLQMLNDENVIHRKDKFK